MASSTSLSLSSYVLALGMSECWVLKKIQDPLETIMEEIDRALKAGFHYVAVSTLLTLPDICVSLISADSRSNGSRYEACCDANLGENFGFVTGKDLYSLRCGVSHNGRFGDLKHNVARVLLALPGPGNFTNCLTNDAYLYSIEDFCSNFMDSVRQWYFANKDNNTVQTNIGRIVQYRRDGLSPYVSGFPVLA